MCLHNIIYYIFFYVLVKESLKKFSAVLYLPIFSYIRLYKVEVRSIRYSRQVIFGILCISSFSEKYYIIYYIPRS